MQPKRLAGKPCHPTVGVVFTTYNRPLILNACSRVMRGRPGRFEIAIADDGRVTKARLIERARRAWGLNIRHVWQEDIGFRKCAASSTAPSSKRRPSTSSSSDGDCIPHPEFVAGHLSLARPGYFVSGGCVRLGDGIARDSACGCTRRQVFDTRWPTLGESGLNLQDAAVSAAVARTHEYAHHYAADLNGYTIDVARRSAGGQRLR
jgi:hypothetical protein